MKKREETGEKLGGNGSKRIEKNEMYLNEMSS